jgi:glutaredoxin 3
MKIKIYMTPTCEWSKKLKVWLKKKKIDYTECDVAESQNKTFRDELIEKSGQVATPVVDIDGKILVGFDEKKLEKALA